MNNARSCETSEKDTESCQHESKAHQGASPVRIQASTVRSAAKYTRASLVIEFAPFCCCSAISAKLSRLLYSFRSGHFVPEEISLVSDMNECRFRRHPMTIERRMHPRVPFRANVSISWLAGTEVTEICAKGVDLSGYGMLVEARISIPSKTSVSVKVNQFGYSGNATVVRSDRRGTRTVIGLHFSTLIPFYVEPVYVEPGTWVDENGAESQNAYAAWGVAKRGPKITKIVCFLRGHDFEIATDWVQLALRCRRCNLLSDPEGSLGSCRA